jgi:hypothetical protein
MLVTIQRITSAAQSIQGTFGRCSLSDNGPTFDSLEPPALSATQSERVGLTCIEPGTYEAYRQNCPSIGRKVYQLKIPDTTVKCQINWGVFAGQMDKGYYRDLLGMIALGFGTGIMQPPDADFQPQLGLLRSRAALASFLERTQGYGVRVKILA